MTQQQPGRPSPYVWPPQQPYNQPPRKPYKRISGGGVAAIVISVIMVPVLIIVLLFGGLTLYISQRSSAIIDEATSRMQSDDNKPKAGSIDLWYNIKERPTYQDAIDYIHNLSESVTNAIETDADGFIKQNQMEWSDSTKKYILDYAAILLKYDNYKNSDDSVYSVQTSELDNIIAARKNDVMQVERHFNNHEALGVTITLTGENGEIYTTDEANTATLKKTWPELEAQVAAYQYNGNDWLQAAKQAASLAEMQIDWNFDDLYKACPSGTNLTKNRTQAAYCPTTPNLLYANTSMPNWDNAYALATVKHEIAHHAIHMRCGVISPQNVVINGVDRTEAVTQSYAVMFLGADENELRRTMGDEYKFDETTNRVAQQIHDGQCKAS
ncbi:hypothetical protein [Bifidobacterium moukalabense]|uniref:hypothetical protein n=1 Tax=Bifidobacterium moukalabense TaxID=1333651 RepID=UPI0010F54529|nr:hypothetical protein [Bifidobacterium moukalabense]